MKHYLGILSTILILLVFINVIKGRKIIEGNTSAEEEAAAAGPVAAGPVAATGERDGPHPTNDIVPCDIDGYPRRGQSVGYYEAESCYPPGEWLPGYGIDPADTDYCRVSHYYPCCGPNGAGWTECLPRDQADCVAPYIWCGDTGTAPSESGVGATLFQHGDQGGWSASFDVGEYTSQDLVDSGGRSNDTSSVKVEPGFELEVFELDNFQGDRSTIPAGRGENFEDFMSIVWRNGQGLGNDSISSIKVRRISEGDAGPAGGDAGPAGGDVPIVGATLYQHDYFTGSGWSANFGAGEYNSQEFIAKGASNDDTSSLKVGTGYEAQLFEHGDFTGGRATFPAGRYDLQSLRDRGIENDSVSSIKVRLASDVTPTGVTLFQHGDQGGWSANFPVGEYTSQDLVDSGGRSNDTSSVKVEPGFVLEVFEGQEFDGNNSMIPAGRGEDFEDFMNIVSRNGLGPGNDSISSIKVRKTLSSMLADLENKLRTVRNVEHISEIINTINNAKSIADANNFI